MDIFSRKKRSEIMSKVRHKDSKIEILLRKEIWKEGFRYRKNPANYFGKPDLVLKKYKSVIFVDSCFWHGCKKHREFPKTRKKFWENKIFGTIKRDKQVNLHYKKEGWKIIRVWEHDLKNNLNKVVRKVTVDLNKLEIVGKNKRFKSHIQLLRDHFSIIEELKRRSVVRTRNSPVSDYAEWLVHLARRFT